jgi:arginine decarboxylase
VIDLSGSGANIDLHDPRGLAADAPLLAAWLEFTAATAAGRVTPFTIPGHKQRADLVGSVVSGDVPLHAGLDTQSLAGGLLLDAERRAAQLWTADWCRFSVGGATHGNQALALSVGSPGRPVVVSRTLHRSLLIGLVLAGLEPVWVHPQIDAGTGLPTSVPVAAVEQALADHPDACAVILGDPSYLGTIGDLPGQAAAAHRAGVPLIVDAAWAPHFGFHPDLPPHALTQGADAMVISAHKALPAWSQAALVLARTTASGGLLEPARLERGFEAGHTTSPAGAILASIDAGRALLARDGERLCGELIALVAQARDRLDAVPGLSALRTPLPGGGSIEPTKLVIQLAATGAHGHRVEADLIAAGLPVEMADRDTIVAMVTIGDDAASVRRLTDVLIESVQRHRGRPSQPGATAAWAVVPQSAVSPREAFFAAHETVDADAAIGRVSAELIAPYPPGVPVLAPGEVVTAEALGALRATKADGGRIAYAADPTLTTLQVLKTPP